MAHGENDACMACDRPGCDGCPHYWENIHPLYYPVDERFNSDLNTEYHQEFPDAEE